MKVIIKQVTIADPASPHNLSVKDILIDQGIIQKIENHLPDPADTIIDKPGSYISPGWTDIFAAIPDPGYEFKETLETGANAAAAGGFTAVMVLPNSKPVTDNKSQVEYIV